MTERPDQLPEPPRHHVRTGELSHQEKLARQRRHIVVLNVALVVVLAVLVYAAIFDLDSAAEWIVLGAIVVTAVGTVIAVQSR